MESLLEAFCQHARNPKSFVTGDKGKGDNSAIADEFVEGGFQRKVPGHLTGASAVRIGLKRPSDIADHHVLSDIVRTRGLLVGLLDCISI